MESKRFHQCFTISSMCLGGGTTLHRFTHLTPVRCMSEIATNAYDKRVGIGMDNSETTAVTAEFVAQ